MDIQLKQAKQTIRKFLAASYSDERLAWLLEHARSGRLAFHSCCCLVGIPTADHALRGHLTLSDTRTDAHLLYARLHLPGAGEAERAFEMLGYVRAGGDDSPDVLRVHDERRRRRVTPLVLAEMRRRERARAALAEKEEACLQR